MYVAVVDILQDSSHWLNGCCTLCYQGMPVFVTFLTAGYPTKDSTVDLMLAMESGGADVIELGVPFSDPIADGPAIQESNSVCLI